MKFKGFFKFSLVVVLLFAIANLNYATGQTEDAPQSGNPVGTIDIATRSPADSPEIYEASLVLADSLKELGFDVKITPRPTHIHNTQTREEPWPFNIMLYSWGSRPERLDPNTFLFLPFHSSQAVSGGENRIGFENDEYDRIVDEQAKTMDINKRRPLVYKAQEILADEAVMCVMWYADTVIFYNKERFRGFVSIPGEGIGSEWSTMLVEPITSDRTLRVAMLEEPDMLNPLAMTTTPEVAFGRNIFDRLVRIGPDGNPKAHMAESWNIISDTVIDFTLREGLKWHDGEPVTAEDVEFTFAYYQKWPVPFFKPWVDPIKKVTATGALTVRFELNEPFAPLIGGTLAQLFIIPKHIWKDVPEKVGLSHPDEWTDLSKAMIGSGPFKFEHWRRGEEILVSKHHGYFMEPKIDEMLFIVYGNNDAVAGALEMNQIDVHTVPPNLLPAQINQLRKMSHLEETTAPAIGFAYFLFNIRKPPFDDKALRQALMYAVDYDLLIEAILEGRGTQGGPGKIITPANEAYYNPNIFVPSFNLSRARELLKEAGYRWDSRGQIHYPEDK